MSVRKFFKSNRCRSLPQHSTTSSSLIEDFIESNDAIDPIPTIANKRKQRNQIVVEPIDHSNDLDSDSSGFHSPSTNRFEDFEFDDDFEPILRSSTPKLPSESDSIYFDKKNEKNDSYFSFEQSHNGDKKVDLWEKAMEQNEELRTWINDFNKHIEMVDESEIVIKTIDK